MRAPLIPAVGLPSALAALLGRWSVATTGWLLKVEFIDWQQAGLWLETVAGQGQTVWAKVSYHPLSLEFEWQGNRVRLQEQDSEWIWRDSQQELLLELQQAGPELLADIQQAAYPWLGHWYGCWEGSPKIHLVLSQYGTEFWLHYLCPGDIRYGSSPSYWRWQITDSWSWLLPDQTTLHLAVHEHSIELTQQGKRPFYSAELVRSSISLLSCPEIEQLQHNLLPLLGHERQLYASRFFQQYSLQSLPILLAGAEPGWQRLLFLAQAAVHAEVLADFNCWVTGMHPMHAIPGTHLHWLVLDLPVTARFDYQLLTDSCIHLDPWNRFPVNRFGQINRSSCALPESLVLPSPSHQLAGTLQQVQLAGRTLGLYLPPAEGPWCLLLVQDGDEAQFDMQLASQLDRLIQAGSIPPVMAVCISTSNRMAEYALNHQYQDWLINQLLPELEASFPVSPEQDDWALLGISMGAIQSMFMGLSGSFGRLALITPAGPIAVREPLLHLLRQQSLPVRRIVMNLAEFDYAPWFRFGRTLQMLWQQQGLELQVQVRADGHGYGYYQACLSSVLQRLWS